MLQIVIVKSKQISTRWVHLFYNGLMLLRVLVDQMLMDELRCLEKLRDRRGGYEITQ